MNKLKKVGLTALATTLVSTASYAGELSASGSATLNYSGLNTSSESNPWTMGNSVTFSGGGDLDNGMTVNVSYELDGNIMDDYSMTLGLPEGMGSVSFSGASVNVGGVDKVKDIVPTAYTAVYENTNTVDNGLATTSGRSTTGMWGYNYSAGGLMLSLGYTAKNSTAAFMVGLYVFAMAAMGYHLQHGFSSAFQSLGFNHEKYTPIIKTIGTVFCVLVPLAFASIPVYLYYTQIAH